MSPRNKATARNKILLTLVLASLLSPGAGGRYASALPLSWESSALADSSDQQVFTQLESKLLRPTFAELLQAFHGKLPKSHPTAAASPGASQVLQILPDLIAYLERSYPGGIWAPLGRDTANTGDALDAFYTQIGMPGRVKRINASTQSFTASIPDLVGFLDTAGIPLDPKTIADARPVVMFDYASYSGYANTVGHSSQSARIMRAAYEAFEQRGGKRTDLLKKFNLMTMAKAPDPSRNIEQYLADQTDYLRRNAGPPSEILGVPNYSYGLEWHDVWGPFTRQPDGSVITRPSNDNQVGVKQTILADVLQIAHEVKKPEFLKRVEEACAKLGVKFMVDSASYKEWQEKAAREEHRRKKEERARLEKTLAEYPAAMRASLQKIVQNAPAWVEPPANTKVKYLSPVASELHDWLKKELVQADKYAEVSEVVREEGPNGVVGTFILGITDAVNAGKLRSRDYRRLLGFAISAANVDATTPSGASMLKFLSQVQAREKVLSQALTEKAEFFKTTFEQKKRIGMEKTHAHYDAIMSHL